jgi:2-polyprenyl-3-methyl-5-hydroxy-6-metoxy-1,4-benzoquinol methylase
MHMTANGTTHVAEVKDFFEAPQGYFDRRQFDIDIRTTTVRELTMNQSIEDILDVGCGNGSISIPLLGANSSRKLTLLDLSEKMLDLARTRLSEEQRQRVRIINDDLMTAELGQKYDLVICLGVMAHVDSPKALLDRISSLLKPGGRLILEVTDSFHPVGRMLWLYHYLLTFIRPAGYTLNRLRRRDVFNDCQSAGLHLVTCYRYSLPPPGSQRVASHDSLFRLTRSVFGTPMKNRRAWLGNISIAEFTN